MNELSVHDVRKTYGKGKRANTAVDGVSFTVRAGTTLAVIGESGSGKSTLGRIVLGAEPVDSGEVRVDGRPLGDHDARGWQEFRRTTSIVLQEPELALNPRRTVGQSVQEPLDVHYPQMPVAERRRKGEEALAAAHLDPGLWSRYPAQLSGGQQQRVGIARAIVTEPTFVVLDEPTASLDLSVRGRILDTLNELQERIGMSYLLITHDMSTVSAMADDVVVLLQGQAVEHGAWETVRRTPEHPYTQRLLSAVLPVRQQLGADSRPEGSAA
ncbi:MULTISPECIES: ABC transporter ATP-binding protein [unclassified Modestobacter]